MKAIAAVARVTVSIVAVLFVLAGAPAILWFQKDIGSAVAVAAFGFAAFLMVRIDQVAELSLGPLKARMRETIAEANATVKQLRSVALELARSGLTTLMADNFWAGVSQAQRFAFRDRILALLKEIGASPDELEYASRDWNKGIAIIFHRIISHLAVTAVAPTDQAKVTTAFQSLVDMETWHVASPEKLEEVAKQHAVLTPEVQGWVDDYRHFLRTGEIRRLDEFQKG